MARRVSSATPDTRAEALRLEAEERLPAGFADLADEPTDLPRLIHELRVHQLELEMQNEELQLARAQLEETRDRYIDLYEFAPIGYLSLSQAARITAINLAGASLLGADRHDLLNLHFTRLVAAVDQDRWHRHFQHALQQSANQRIELTLQRTDGSTFPAQLDSAHATDADGSPALRMTLTDITERRQLEAARQEAPSWIRLKKIADRLPGMIYEFRLRPDGSMCFPYASEAMHTIHHVSPDEARDDASCVLARIHPDDREAFTASIHQSAQTLSPWRHEYRVSFDDGSIRCLLGNANPTRDADGSTLWYGFITDVTEHRRTEEKLQLAAKVFAHTREGIMITDADGNIIEVNKAFTQITGYDRDEVIGHNPRILSSGRHGKEFYELMWRTLTKKGYWYSEVWNRRKNGELFAEMLTVSAVYDAKGQAEHYVALFSDITALKEHESQLEHIAHYDALTTLPNRVLFADRLHQTMAQAQRRRQKLVVAYLDLDGFKTINDRHGHETGDQLLMALAARMKQILREGDTLARIGGDEFVAVLVDLPDIAASTPMLSRMLAAAAEPVVVGDLLLQVSASVGVTFYPQAEEVDADQLLRQADQAMYQAKLSGKNRYHVFDAELDRNTRGHHESVARIRKAMVDDEFVLYYQPKVNMRTGAVIGAEALIRWQHPQRGLLSPAVFLPVIEDDPLAVVLGEWVVDSALAQMETWHAAGLNVPVSVNIGARQLQASNFVQRLRSLLAAHPEISPANLELEVLETSALEDLAQVSGVIEACLNIGIHFSLDDFGTGYSSLTYLKRLHVSQLKIDQSFIRDMLDDPDDLAIVESVLGLATAFRRKVIAEGVESPEHGEMLLQLGCELAQGFGIARPMPAHELAAWMASWRPDPLWTAQPAVSSADLQLLYATVEHRAWIAALGKHLTDKRAAPPQLDHHQCRLGEWLDAERLATRGTGDDFQTIDAVHQQAHALATELCTLSAHGRQHEAIARLGELSDLRDTLLALLKGGQSHT